MYIIYLLELIYCLFFLNYLNYTTRKFNRYYESVFFTLNKFKFNFIFNISVLLKARNIYNIISYNIKSI